MTSRFESSHLRDVARRVLCAAGASNGDASVVADGLVWADLRGRHPQGVTRLPELVDRLRHGGICSPAALVWEIESGAVARLDAGGGFGHVAGRAAVLRAVELARQHGAGAVAVRRSNHLGAASWFCDLAAHRGCLAFAFTNAAPKVAAFGGTRPVLGTNPLAFGCPDGSGAPILVDLATATTAGSGVRERAARGKRLPPGTALDEDGRPTRDPAAAARGALLPAAGAKGFALGLMVEILAGVLTGAGVAAGVGSFRDLGRPSDTGHLFLALDPARFGPLDAFVERTDRLIGAIRAAEGNDAVRIPGELRARLAARHAREGILLPPESLAALQRVAGRLGLEELASPRSIERRRTEKGPLPLSPPT